MTPANALRSAVDALIAPPANVDVALKLIGGSKPELAMRLAGTRDKSSKAYKAALRSVQRYTTEGAERRRPRADAMAKIRQAVLPQLRRRVIEAMGRRGVRVDLSALVLVSTDERWREVDDVEIDGGELEATGCIDAMLGGRWGEAADAFAVAWGIAYGIGPCVFLEVDLLELRLGRR